MSSSNSYNVHHYHHGYGYGYVAPQPYYPPVVQVVQPVNIINYTPNKSLAQTPTTAPSAASQQRGATYSGNNSGAKPIKWEVTYDNGIKKTTSVTSPEDNSSRLITSGSSVSGRSERSTGRCETIVDGGSVASRSERGRSQVARSEASRSEVSQKSTRSQGSRVEVDYTSDGSVRIERTIKAIDSRPHRSPTRTEFSAELAVRKSQHVNKTPEQEDMAITKWSKKTAAPSVSGASEKTERTSGRCYTIAETESVASHRTSGTARTGRTANESIASFKSSGTARPAASVASQSVASHRTSGTVRTERTAQTANDSIASYKSSSTVRRAPSVAGESVASHRTSGTVRTERTSRTAAESVASRQTSGTARTVRTERSDASRRTEHTDKSRR